MFGERIEPRHCKIVYLYIIIVGIEEVTILDTHKQMSKRLTVYSVFT